MGRIARPAAWVLVAAMIGCSNGEDTRSAATPSDVIDACNAACAKQANCPSSAAPVDCTAICAAAETPDASAGCDPTAQKARFDQCGLLECSHIGSCVVDVSVSCQGSAGGGGGAAGGSPPGGSGGSVAAGGAGAANGGTASAGAPSGGTGGTSGADCTACGGNAGACCTALAARLGQDPTQCADTTEAKCLATPPSEQTAFVDECKSQLQTGASLGLQACQ